MRALLTILLLVEILCFVQITNGQNVEGKEMNFEYQWGTYGHFKVSSKEGKVYVKVRHPYTYTDTSIMFTSEDRERIWKELKRIDFFSYTESYSPNPPESDTADTLPDFTISHIHTPDSSWSDTFWTIKPIIAYFAEEIIPYAEYALSIYTDGQTKTVKWRGGVGLYEYVSGKKIKVEDVRYDNLFSLGELIREIVIQKEGYKNLPESNLTYR